jgi:hypothetical protein
LWEDAHVQAAPLQQAASAPSRCLISPAFSADGRTVAASSDAAFAKGDVVAAIDDVKLDPNSHTPVQDLLAKHAASGSVRVTIDRAGTSMTLKARCTDSRRYVLQLLQAISAVAQHDAGTCADRFDAAARQHTLEWKWAFRSYYCHKYAERIPEAALNQGLHDLWIYAIDDAKVDPDTLTRVRGSVRGAILALQDAGAAELASDLQHALQEAGAAAAAVQAAAGGAAP